VVEAEAVEAIRMKTEEALHHLEEIICIKILSKMWPKSMQPSRPSIETVYYALEGIKTGLLTLIAITRTLTIVL
jgi:hypothetical protein